jgi:DNA-binding response OmpR family regulator
MRKARRQDRRKNKRRWEDCMAKSILVVEDEPNIVLSLQFLMKQAGFEVRVAADGEQALREVEERAPDLILLDVMIPRRDGYDVCQTIRANPNWNGIYIIMLTAKGREVDREKGLSLGANDYVTKPFSTRDLTEKVKQLLASSGGP